MRPARCFSDRGLQPDAVRLERVAFLLELSDFPLLLNAEHSPCNDARRDQDETDEHHGDHAAAPRLYSALRHARSRALRARGFRMTSSAEAGMARLVIVVPSGRPRQVQTGCFGGQTQAALQSRNAFLTMRSSPEWYAITTNVPPGNSRSRSAGSARSKPGSSSLTAMR